jgi:hypothetical protein
LPDALRTPTTPTDGPSAAAVGEPRRSAPAGAAPSSPDQALQLADRPPHRRSWSYLRAPLAIYLVVMVPICAMQIVLICAGTPTWMKASAAVVVALTIAGLLRGYVQRLKLTSEAACLASLTRTIRIPWSRVNKTGVYIPGGGLGATEYVYITTCDRPPAGKWEIDEQTIQVQARPGLIEAIEECRARAAQPSAPLADRSPTE